MANKSQSRTFKNSMTFKTDFHFPRAGIGVNSLQNGGQIAKF